jgi:hypothetical protein
MLPVGKRSGMTPKFRWEFGSRPWRVGAVLQPLDLLRKLLTKGLQVDVGQPEARRGAEVEALVTISSPRGLGDVEVGLVCTEYYDEETSSTTSSSTGSNGYTSTSRTTSSEVAHQAWLPVESSAGVQSVRLAIPAEAPFSYKGHCLSFKWEVVARGRRSRRLDAQARQEISVLP